MESVPEKEAHPSADHAKVAAEKDSVGKEKVKANLSEKAKEKEKVKQRLLTISIPITIRTSQKTMRKSMMILSHSSTSQMHGVMMLTTAPGCLTPQPTTSVEHQPSRTGMISSMTEILQLHLRISSMMIHMKSRLLMQRLHMMMATTTQPAGTVMTTVTLHM